MHHNFKIWGSDWEGEPILAKNLQAGGARISPEESVKIYNATKINLNLHSSVRAEKLVSNGDFVNPRTFELAACGAFQLVDQRALMGELFAPDELAIFSSIDEMQEMISHFLSHPDERSAFASKARARALAQHTYAHRMQSLIETACAAFPKWPYARKSSDLLADIPEDLRGEINVLLERLELPGNVSFEDLISRVRQQTGVMSDLETSLLFLDEWRKQYTKKQ
jgi:spore maturation protein CgeB